ncbi:hypothetical protein [Geodermatophilus sp. SYSU D01105]
MRTRHRILVTLALTLGVILTAGLPAQAAFGDSVTAATAPITAGTVAPVTRLQATAPCTAQTTTWTTTTRKWPNGLVTTARSPEETTSDKVKSPANGTSTTTLDEYRLGDGSTVTVTRTTVQRTTIAGSATWTAVPTRNFSGYTLTVPGPDPINANVGSATRYDYGPVWIDRDYDSLPVTVVTRTSHGWTASAVVWVKPCK